MVEPIATLHDFSVLGSSRISEAVSCRKSYALAGRTIAVCCLSLDWYPTGQQTAATAVCTIFLGSFGHASTKTVIDQEQQRDVRVLADKARSAHTSNDYDKFTRICQCPTGDDVRYGEKANSVDGSVAFFFFLSMINSKNDVLSTTVYRLAARRSVEFRDQKDLLLLPHRRNFVIVKRKIWNFYENLFRMLRIAGISHLKKCPVVCGSTFINSILCI